jgi:hypothetical protein
MSRKRFTQFIVIGVLLLFVGMAHADFASEVIELVNIEREARDLHPLSYNEELALRQRLKIRNNLNRNLIRPTRLAIGQASFKLKCILQATRYRICP